MPLSELEQQLASPLCTIEKIYQTAQNEFENQLVRYGNSRLKA